MSATEAILFGSKDISQVFKSIIEKIDTDISGLDETFLLNLNEDEYLNPLLNKYLLTLPKIEFGNAYSQSYEKDFPATYFPESFKLPDYKSQKTAFTKYFIPVKDPDRLLNYQPVALKYVTEIGFSVSASAISKEYINDLSKPKRTRKVFDSDATQIQVVLKVLISEIRGFNEVLKKQCLIKLESRRKQLINR
jgi:hypothetical protein